MRYFDDDTGIVDSSEETRTYSFGVGRNSPSQNTGYLRSYDGAPTNLAQISFPFDIVITGMSALCDTSTNEWRIELRKNLNPLAIATLTVFNLSTQNTVDDLDIVVLKNEKLSVYLVKGVGGNGAGSNISYPRAEIFYRRRS